MVTIIAEFQVKSGCADEFTRLAAECTRNTRKEAGNLSYKVFNERNNGNTFIFVEEWANDVAIEKHNNMSHFKTFMEKIKTITVGEPSIKQIMRVSAIR